MAKTVEEGFREFLQKLTPTATETAAAKSHRASVEACLKANFGISRFFRSGSFGNGTSIRGYSDVDYFASIPHSNISHIADDALMEVWEVLDNRFPVTGVAIKRPAIYLPFGTDASESTDVVPAKYEDSDEDDNLIYKIPNPIEGKGGWILASPDAHNNYIDNVNEELSKKVKPLIRFIKAWKYYRNVPIFSFYLEMFVARYAYSEKSIVYSIDIQSILDKLWQNQLSAIQDPIGISGYIYPCVNDAYKEDALSKLLTASIRADKAREAEEKNDIKEAFEWWDKLYDYEFPYYSN